MSINEALRLLFFLGRSLPFFQLGLQVIGALRLLAVLEADEIRLFGAGSRDGHDLIDEFGGRLDLLAHRLPFLPHQCGGLLGLKGRVVADEAGLLQGFEMFEQGFDLHLFAIRWRRLVRCGRRGGNRHNAARCEYKETITIHEMPFVQLRMTDCSTGSSAGRRTNTAIEGGGNAAPLAGRPNVRAAKRNQDGARVSAPPRRKWTRFRPGRFLPLDRPGLIGVR